MTTETAPKTIKELACQVATKLDNHNCKVCGRNGINCEGIYCRFQDNQVIAIEIITDVINFVRR